MKKIFAYILPIVMIASCYDDFVKDYDYGAVYFTYQVNVRTLVVGEGMKIQVGVALGGIKENTVERIVNYQLDNSLINDETLTAMKNSSAAYIKNSVSSVTQLELLPESYYRLSDNEKFVIEKGQHAGVVTLKADSVNFLADASTLTATYALPLRIKKATNTDSVLYTKDYTVIGLKYENMLFGNYWHGGVTVEKDATGATVNTTKYYTAIPSPDAKAWALTTVGPNSLTTNGVSSISSSSKKEFKITLNGGDIVIESMPGATYQVLPDGASSFNRAKLLQNRKIFLSYKYQLGNGNWCYAKDTLTFRNRIRDGVNEWQDENPSHYE